MLMVAWLGGVLVWPGEEGGDGNRWFKSLLVLLLLLPLLLLLLLLLLCLLQLLMVV